MHYKLDLHSHSILSKDGGITKDQYKNALLLGNLDVIAVTDHNDISFAQEVQQQFAEKIIVGEEIWTREGEVIGLFLKKRVPENLSFKETISLIKDQDGLVYIPHPFCHNRFGVPKRVLEQVISQVDIIEGFNPRNLVREDNIRAETFAKENRIPIMVSSDAHCMWELGKTYASVSDLPMRENLTQLLQNALYTMSYTPFWHLFCPKRNRLKKRLGIT